MLHRSFMREVLELSKWDHLLSDKESCTRKLPMLDVLCTFERNMLSLPEKEMLTVN